MLNNFISVGEKISVELINVGHSNCLHLKFAVRLSLYPCITLGENQNMELRTLHLYSNRKHFVTVVDNSVYC